MSAPGTLPEEQLLELLLQLKKTTPDQARTVLAAQPQIPYALITLMVKMNAVNVDVIQKTVASFSAPPTAPVSAPSAAPAFSALPPHLAQQPQSQNQNHYRTPPPQAQPHPSTHSPYPSQNFPQSHNPYANGGQAPQPNSQYGNPNPNAYGGYQAGGSGGGGISETLASMPEDQKAMIMRVISMTPEQIGSLPPQERTSILQLRATLGLPG